MFETLPLDPTNSRRLKRIAVLEPRRPHRLAWSGDGTRVIAVTSSALGVLEADPFAPLAWFEPPNGHKVVAFAVRHDGREIAASTGYVLNELHEFHSGAPQGCAIARWSDDGTLLGEEERQDATIALAYRDDGTLIAAGGRWRPEWVGPVGQPRALDDHGVLDTMALSPRGTWLAMDRTEGEVWLVRVDGTVTHVLRPEVDAIARFVFDLDEAFVAVVGTGNLVVFRAVDGVRVGAYAVHASANTVAVHKDGTCVFDASAPGEGHTLRSAPNGAHISAATVSPTGEAVVVAYGDGVLRRWDDGRDAPVDVDLSTLDSSARFVVFSPDSAHLVAVNHQGDLFVWRSSDLQLVARVAGTGMKPNGMEFDPSGDVVVVVDGEKTVGHVRIIDARTWAVRAAYHGQAVLSLAMAPGVAFFDGWEGLLAWDWRMAAAPRVVHRPPFRALRLAARPDGRVLAVAYSDELRLVRADTGETLAEAAPERGKNYIHDLAFEPHGDHLAVTDGRTLRLYDTAGDGLVRTFVQAAYGQTVSFDGDGRYVAGGGALWDLSSGTGTGLPYRADGEDRVAMSPDRRLVAAIFVGSLYVYGVTP